MASVAPSKLVAPCAVIDKSAEAAEDPNYLLTLADIEAWENEHGPLPAGGWLFLRTGWDARAHDQDAFLNGAQTPGPDVEAARWLAETSAIVGFGVETVGTDAGVAHSFDPPFPVHHFLLGAGKYGLTQLANLAELPPTGAIVVVAPLKLVDGTGSPCRVFALRLTSRGCRTSQRTSVAWKSTLAALRPRAAGRQRAPGRTRGRRASRPGRRGASSSTARTARASRPAARATRRARRRGRRRRSRTRAGGP